MTHVGMSGLLPLAAEHEEEGGGSDIEIGHHVTRDLGGWIFNIDTIWTTLIAGAIVLILGFWVRGKLTQPDVDHVPSKIQMIWEAVVGQVNTQVEDNLGKVHPFVAPLAVSLFFFILIANWLELVPSKLNEDTPHLLAAPTADTNLTYALAAVTIVSVWTYGIRQKGVKGYFKHFLEPFPVLLPLNILEELVKPITLALRLFGNIFAGGIMLALIGLIPHLRPVGAEPAVEALRHVHRRHPGIHLRPADRALLRDGRRRTRTRGRARDRRRARRQQDVGRTTRTSALTRPGESAQEVTTMRRETGAEPRRDQWQ